MSMTSSNSAKTSGLGCRSEIISVVLNVFVNVQMVRVMSRVAAESRPVLSTQENTKRGG